MLLRRPIRLRGWLTLSLAIATVAGAQAGDSVTLASATTPEAAGLYRHILPRFEKDTGVEVRVVAVGTGQALEIARRGDADALLVHHPRSEQQFVEDGFGLARHRVMHNDFVIVGPRADPARIRGMNDAPAALTRIAESKAPFASRGDHSGTHFRELELWRAAGRDPARISGGWYRQLGAGMGVTLNTAAAMQAYALTDRGTWLAMMPQGLELLVEGDPPLANPYTAIPVNPERHPHINAAGARHLIAWLLSEEGQQAIASYRISGQSPFHPRAANIERSKPRKPDRSTVP